MNTPPSNKSINLSGDALDLSDKQNSSPEGLSKILSKDSGNSILSELSGSKVKFKAESLSTIITNKGKEFYNHWSVNYCTGAEDIQGILFFANDTLNFIGSKDYEPSKAVLSSWLGFSRKSEAYNKKLGDFQLQINIHDITECILTTFSVPSMKSEEQTDKSHIIQFNLLDHGDFKLDDKVDQVCSDLRDNDKAYACVYFSIKTNDLNDSDLDQSDTVVQYIQSKFNQTKQIYKNKARLTEENIMPYFELLPDSIKMDDTKVLKNTKKLIREQCERQIANFKQDRKSSPNKYKKVTEVISKARRVPSRGSKTIIVNPIVLDHSDIVDIDKFAQIISYVPDIYHSFEWKMLYSSTQHGTSYNNMLRRAKHSKPFVVIIKDAIGNIFGAYGNEDLRFSQQYYGGGETFVFTFKKNDRIKAYPWSKKNDMFMYVNEEGFMFGAGPFYGLWIDCELARGRTHMCDTFSNQLLSDNADFNISKIEVWGVVDPLSQK